VTAQGTTNTALPASPELHAIPASPASPALPALPPTALYVHVPFCVSLCPYCDFVVVAGAGARGPANRLAEFTDAVLAEIELRADAADARFGQVGEGGRPALDSLYLGGGTPTLLPSAAIAAIVATARARFGLVDGAEVTVEANPGPDERGDARALREAGVTRISYGAQRLDVVALRGLGRRHRPDDVAASVSAARSAGIASVNLDLLYDLPDERLDGWMDTLEVALALAPDHLSLYALTLDDPDAEGLTGPLGDHLPTTAGARRWRDRARPRQDEDRAVAMYHHATVRLAETGFEGYEISNWARPGHESRHNLAYWERRPYEAVGPGAHAFDGSVRRWNAARLGPWLAALSPGDGRSAALPPGGETALDPATAASETVILGLRTARGVPAAAALAPPLDEVFGWALATELVDVSPDDRIVLTTRGRLLSNELFSRLV
jgi:oxygen-independent coproporphyrinogen-3 oxidase